MKTPLESAKKLLALAGVVGVALFSSPVTAFAQASEQAAEGGSDSSGLALLIPNMLEWIPMLLGFIIFWIILAKFAWPVIIGMLDKRVSTIKDSLEQAESAKLEGERLLSEYKAQLDDARKESAQIIADAKAAADEVRSDITAKAQEEAQAMLAKATLAIEAEKKAAIAELQGSLADLSVAVAGRVIGQDMSDVEHRKIIERYLAEAGSFDAN